ncbi:armadillo-type protein [Pelagophyceae sp. CCMP2097]|nr:armadillo-type protein [Pelagophyceae sp. CCMP2097]
MASQQSFGLLNALLSADNASRSEAEAWVNGALRSSAAGVLAKDLVAAVATADWAPALRVLAAVVARRSVISDARVWASLDLADRRIVRLSLLDVVRRDGTVAVRRAAADAVAAAVQAGLGGDEFPEALAWVAEALAAGGAPGALDGALELLERLAQEASPRVLPRLGAIVDLLCANAAQHCAGVARCALALAAEAETAAQALQCSALMPCCVAAAASADSSFETRLAVLRGLADVAVDDFGRARVDVFGPHLPAVARAAIDVGAASDRDEETRATALELVGALAQAAGRETGSMLADAALRLALAALAEGPPDLATDDDWACASCGVDGRDDDDDDLDDDLLASAAAALLGRVADAHGGDALIRGGAPLIAELLRSPSARARRAALIGVSLLAESSMGTFFVSEFVPALLPPLCAVAAGDGSLRVRDAAFHCLAQLADDFGEAQMRGDDEDDEDDFWEGFGEDGADAPKASTNSFHSAFAPLIVPACAAAISQGVAALGAGGAAAQRYGAARVARSAAAALAGACHPRHCCAASIEAQAAAAWQACVAALALLGASGDAAAAWPLAARCATAAACVAQCCGPEFWRAHAGAVSHEVATAVARCLAATQGAAAAQRPAGGRPHRDAHVVASCLGRCLEALALCGSAAGADVFWQSVAGPWLWDVLAQAATLADDFEQLEQHWLAAAARFATIVDDDGAARRRIVGAVTARALDRAARDVDYGLFDDERSANDFATERAGCEVVPVGRKYVVVNTSRLITAEVAMRATYELSKGRGAEDVLRNAEGDDWRVLMQLCEVVELPWIAFTPTLVVVIAAILGRLFDDASILAAHDGDAARAAQFATALLVRAAPPLIRALRAWRGRCAAPNTDPEALEPTFDATCGLVEALCDGLKSVHTLHGSKPAVIFEANPELHVAVIDECCAVVEDELRLRAKPPANDSCDGARASMLGFAGDAIGYVLKLNGNAALFERSKIGAVVRKCLAGAAQLDDDVVSFALCAAVDAVEHCGASADAVAATVLPALVAAAASETSHALRRAGGYGLGVVLTRPSGGALATGPALRRAVDVLVAVAQAGGDEEDDEDDDAEAGMARDNALASLVVVLVRRGADVSTCYSAADARRLGAFVLDALPLRYDVDEGRKVHKTLVEALREPSRAPLLLGDSAAVAACLERLVEEQEAPAWAVAVASRGELPLAAQMRIRRRFGGDARLAAKAAGELVDEYQFVDGETRGVIDQWLARQ